MLDGTIKFSAPDLRPDGMVKPYIRHGRAETLRFNFDTTCPSTRRQPTNGFGPRKLVAHPERLQLRCSFHSTRENDMKRQNLWLLSMVLMTTAASAQTPSDDIARGNMPKQMDVNEMDANHDGMITKAEFAAYGEKIWKVISHGKPTVPVDIAATDFATGHMAMNTQDMDADHDGTISHEEFVAYASKAFDKVKNPQGKLTLSDTTKYFATGNMKP
jgi:hypothetical protein